MLNVYNEIKTRGVNILVITELKNLNLPNCIVLQKQRITGNYFIIFLQNLCYNYL